MNPTAAASEPNQGGTRRSSRTWRAASLGAALAVGGAMALSGCGGSSSSTATPKSSSTTARSSTGSRRPFSFPGTFGTLASVSGSSLTVKSGSDTTTTVTTTSSTKVTVTTSGTSADLTNGATVRALGTVTNGQLAANSIEIGALSDLNGGFGGGARPGRAGGEGGAPNGSIPSRSIPGGEGRPAGGARFTPITGTVSDVAAGSFTLTESNGTAGRVTISSSTTFSVIKSTTLAGLTIGKSVVVAGAKSSSGSIAATSVSQGNGGFGGFGGGFGRPGGSTTTTS